MGWYQRRLTMCPSSVLSTRQGYIVTGLAVLFVIGCVWLLVYAPKSDQYVLKIDRDLKSDQYVQNTDSVMKDDTHPQKLMSVLLQKQGTDNHSKSRFSFSAWPVFSADLPHHYMWYSSNCWSNNANMTIGIIKDILRKWAQSRNPECLTMHSKFTNMYTVIRKSSKTIFPPLLHNKMLKWMNNDEKLVHDGEMQEIISLFNEYTTDENMYNPFREKRPIPHPTKPEHEYIENITLESKRTCDFCSFRLNTAEDVFGRIESTLSYTASNAFKYDGWHSLVAPKSHHPLTWTREVYTDMMHLACTWLLKVHNIDSNYRYPILLWDLFPRSGASQVHPHLHASLDIQNYYSVIERWRRAAETYYVMSNRNYFTDFVHIHNSIGLAVQLGSAVAVAHMTPRKDNEMIIFSETVNDDFFLLIYCVLRAYIDDMKVYTFSMAVAFPTMDDEERTGRIPAYARVVTRGSMTSSRSDISSLELLSSSNVNVDPYKVMRYVTESVKKHTAGK